MTININLCLEFCKGIPSGPEARQLARDYKAGNQSARDRLIIGNMPLVFKMITSFHVSPMLIDDAFEEGVIGLMHAIEVYDPDHESGAGFSTIAYWWVMHYVQQLLRREIRHQERETTVDHKIEVEYEHNFSTDVDMTPLLGKLSRRERKAMENVTGNVKMCDLASEMGISKQRVQQIKAKAIDKLRGMVR
jgi:RNA polymerase sigma factor (sigma-70 family)